MVSVTVCDNSTNVSRCGVIAVGRAKGMQAAGRQAVAVSGTDCYK